MTEAAKKKEKESTEARDEKIARIIKEFRETFRNDFEGGDMWNWEYAQERIIPWLTQTLTTLLNEE